MLLLSLLSPQAMRGQGMATGSAPPAGLKVIKCQGRSVPQLEDITEKSGIKFRHLLAPEARYIPESMSGGVLLLDFDRDGWLDIYFCLYAYYQGTGQYKYPSPYHAAENGPPNFLMRNHHDGTFRDVTAQCGLNQNNTRYSFCCGWNDYDGDGWPDLYVVNDFGRKNLYRNNGDGSSRISLRRSASKILAQG